MKFKDIFFYVVGTFIMMIIPPATIITLGFLYPENFMPPITFTPIFGAFTSAVGIFFTVWSNIELWKKGKGGPAVIGKIKLMQETKHLVTTGPYALCRNPMHLGLILFYLGLCCAVNSLYSLIIPLLFGIFAYCFAIFLDEPRLKRDFGDEYAVWSERVPRFWPKPRKS